MKKTAFAITFISMSVLLLVGCASNKKTVSKGNSAGAEYTIGNDGQVTVVAEKPSASKKETAEEKKARKAAEKLAASQKKDPYTGWVYIPQNNPKVKAGDINLILKTGTGSFGIYVIPEQGKEIPLLSTYDAYNSSFFSLKYGRKEYRLNRENGVKISTRKTAYGAQIVYTIDKKAQVTADFSLFPSISTSSRVDMIRVTLYATNLGKTIQSFSLKGVFDTILGENAYTHFSTAARSKINGERQYTDMSGEKWIRSANEECAIQFLLDGKGITKPQAVTLASKDLLSGTSWLPSVQESRGFTSVLTYNNSALGINWPTFYLDPQKTSAVTFYISVAADGNEPAGKEFLAALEKGNIALSATPPAYVITSTEAATPEFIPVEELTTFYRTGMPVIDDGEDHSMDNVVEEEDPVVSYVTPSKTEAELEEVSKEEVVEDVVSYTPAVTEVDEPVVSESTVVEPTVTAEPETVDVPKVNDYQLNPEYIQNLLDRIAALEENPSLAVPGEIERLNNELDSILLKLRSLR